MKQFFFAIRVKTSLQINSYANNLNFLKETNMIIKIVVPDSQKMCSIWSLYFRVSVLILVGLSKPVILIAKEENVPSLIRKKKKKRWSFSNFKLYSVHGDYIFYESQTFCDDLNLNCLCSLSKFHSWNLASSQFTCLIHYYRFNWSTVPITFTISKLIGTLCLELLGFFVSSNTWAHLRKPNRSLNVIIDLYTLNWFYNVCIFSFESKVKSLDLFYLLI